jgi:hypothetical protein
MKKICVQNAVGMRLCHDITEIRDGFKGPAFRRNHVITRDDVDHLLNIGKRHVYVWDESIREIHEDECALRIAAALPVEDAHYEGPSEGKMVLKADVEGLFMVDRELLAALNNVPDFTVSTIPDHYAVKPGDRLASMRIIPLVTAEKNIVEAEELCRNRRLFEIHPYLPLRTAVIITGSEVYSGRICDRFEPVIRAKLKKFPGEIIGTAVCDDSADMIRETAGKFIGSGADLLILTGGMSVDPDDVTPSAVRSLGAEIISHGLPSQPGNMTLMAYLDKTAVVGVPGAAISRPVTTLDVLLPQIFTGVRFTRRELFNLAEGGLCQMCRQCHFPNCTYGRY